MKGINYCLSGVCEKIDLLINQKKSSEITIKGEETGLCQFCRYQTKCFEEGNGLTAKPLSIPKPKEENP